jgi:superfamily II DNA helicase RecQ
MPFKMIAVSIRDPGQAEEEWNAFLRSHRVLSVERRFAEDGASSFWCFCIDYLDRDGSSRGAAFNRGKIDYKEVLSPEEFAVFAKLRDLRKELAQAESVPMYTIFTNEQLAKIVQARVKSKAELEKIAGIGDARVGKYGKRVLELLARAWRAEETRPEERGNG